MRLSSVPVLLGLAGAFLVTAAGAGPASAAPATDPATGASGTSPMNGGSDLAGQATDALKGGLLGAPMGAVPGAALLGGLPLLNGLLPQS